MESRRAFLHRTLKMSSLVALNATVPHFISRTAEAAPTGKDNILVVLEMTGGNDGMNTVIPYADDLYHKYRPTLRQTKDVVIRLDDHVGLHKGMTGFKPLLDNGQLAVLQGIGYPNPDRSHFEAMDIWHSADPRRAMPNGWLGRTVAETRNFNGGLPALHLGNARLPLAMQGPSGGAVSLRDQNSFRLEWGTGDTARQSARRRLLADLSTPGGSSAGDDLTAFAQRRQVQTLTAIEQLHELLQGPNAIPRQGNGLTQKLQLIANLIANGFGTRIFYLNQDGFDTHSEQAPAHQTLLADLADSVGTFFKTLKDSGNDRRVRLMTFSEFGRRVEENASKGTDHGAASCMFVAGPSVKGGVVGKHPSLSDLDVGDLKFHTDFRRVYATMLDQWLMCDSQTVLGGQWDHIKELGVRS